MSLRLSSTIWLFLIFLTTFLCLPTIIFAQPGPPPGVDPNLIGNWVDGPGGNKVYRFLTLNGQWLDYVKMPGAPAPTGWAATVATAQQSVTTASDPAAVILDNVPAYDWTYGCVPTGGAMMLGYHDRTGMANIYAGPTNGGVMPIDNSSWESGENPLSATHIGIDGRSSYGHVEDYWDPAGGYDDPYETAGRAAHADDCLADFMGTSRGDSLSNGWTTVMLSNMGYKYYPSTSAVNPASEPILDAAYGIVEYLKSRGYPDYSDKVYNQLIKGAGLIPELGYTFDDYKSEIDAGRPVIIHAGTHTLVGVGYKDPDVVYVHTTWDYIHPDPSTTTHLMTWGGFFQGHEHFAVTVFEIDRDDFDAPIATASSPHGSAVYATTPITVTFSEAMNQAATQGAFSINPSVAGAFSWNAAGTEMTFDPTATLAYNTTYTVTISIAAADLSGLTLNSPYSWSFTTGPAFKPDGLVYDANISAYLGDNIYNTTGLDQSVSRTIIVGGKTTFYVRGQNDGQANDRLLFKGTGSGSNWTIKYIDSATGADVTTSVTGSGWLCNSLASGKLQSIKVEATAGLTVDDSLAYPITVTVSSNGASGSSDVVKCIPSIYPNYKPDALINQASTATYIGNDIYNTTGQWQSESISKKALSKAAFYIRAQNDGKLKDALRFKGPAGDANWSVQYIDSATGNDITTAVTGAGWSTPQISPTAYRSIKCIVIPQPTAAGNSIFTALITVASVTKPDRTDVAKCMTTVLPSYTPDGQVLQSPNYLGDNIYNTNGVGQAATQEILAGSKSTFYIRGQNDGNVPQSLIFSAGAGNETWNVKYIDSATGADITDDMVSAFGWTSSVANPTAIRSVKVEITPAASVIPGSVCTLSLGVFSSIDTEKYDIVQCILIVAAASKPDILPYQASSSSYIGDNVYNTNGSGQTESRSITGGTKTTYYAKLQNDGLYNEPCIVKGTAGNASWTVKYIDSSTSADITAAVTGSGWTTSSIPVGGTRSIKIEVTPAAGLPVGTNYILSVTLAATLDSSKTDVAKFSTTTQ